MFEIERDVEGLTFGIPRCKCKLTKPSYCRWSALLSAVSPKKGVSTYQMVLKFRSTRGDAARWAIEIGKCCQPHRKSHFTLRVLHRGAIPKSTTKRRPTAQLVAAAKTNSNCPRPTHFLRSCALVRRRAIFETPFNSRMTMMASCRNSIWNP